jgi:hypothetical protein
MNSRREFLGTVGAAALTTFFFPGIAPAFGRRKRRCRPCCDHRFTGSCDRACPQSLYGQVNGVNYYHCICCPGPPQSPIDSSDTGGLHPFPIGCDHTPQSDCIQFITKDGCAVFVSDECCQNYVPRCTQVRTAAPPNVCRYRPAPSLLLSAPIPSAMDWDLSHTKASDNVQRLSVQNVAYIDRNTQELIPARIFEIYIGSLNYLLRVGQQTDDTSIPENADHIGGTGQNQLVVPRNDQFFIERGPYHVLRS